jgi:hypothetical protein
MSRVGPSPDPNVMTTELYRETGDASDSRRMFAYDDQAESESIRTRSVLVVAIVILMLFALVAIAR